MIVASEGPCNQLEALPFLFSTFLFGSFRAAAEFSAVRCPRALTSAYRIALRTKKSGKKKKGPV